jgi:hypothetical protein
MDESRIVVVVTTIERRNVMSFTVRRLSVAVAEAYNPWILSKPNPSGRDGMYGKYRVEKMILTPHRHHTSRRSHHVQTRSPGVATYIDLD